MVKRLMANRTAEDTFTLVGRQPCTAGAYRLTLAVLGYLSCGHDAHADVNAAENMLRAGRARRGLVSVEARK